MHDSDLLRVYLNFTPDSKQFIGRIWKNSKSREYVFEYDPAYLSQGGASISPSSLPPKQDTFAAPLPQGSQDPSLGLHGVFADSLPDHWGQRAMQLAFERIGVMQASSLQKLAYVGNRGLGALSYEPEIGQDDDLPSSIQAANLRQAARKIMQGSTRELAPQLCREAGSLGGMHAKFPVLMSPDGCELAIGHLDSKSDGNERNLEHWIIKTPSDNAAYMNAVEYVYSQMAKEAGINSPATLLIHDAENDPYFAIKRFDRVGKNGAQRLHVHSYAGLRQLNFKTDLIDYREMMSYTLWLTDNIVEASELFRRMIFNILAVNQDDHGKNSAYLMNQEGEWNLSPAYDLTFTPGGEMGHQTAIAGVTYWVTRKQVEKVAAAIGLVQWESILLEVDSAVRSWPALARDAGIPDEHITRIGNLMDFHRKQLGIV